MGFLIDRILLAVIPRLNKDPSLDPIFHTLKAIDARERSVKFLLTDENLLWYELLHPRRYVITIEDSTPSHSRIRT